MRVRYLAKCDIFACARLCTFSQWISTIVFFTHWRSRDFLAVRIVARAAVDGPCSRNHSVRSVWCAPIWTRFLRFQNRTNHTGVAVVLGGLCLATQVSMWCGAHTVAAMSGAWGRGVLAVDALEVHLPRVRIFIVSLSHRDALVMHACRILCVAHPCDGKYFPPGVRVMPMDCLVCGPRWEHGREGFPRKGSR